LIDEMIVVYFFVRHLLLSLTFYLVRAHEAMWIW
jgi:hypothetical protein